MDETTLENRLTRLETDIQYVGEMMDDLEERQASIEKLALSVNTLAVQVKRLVDDLCKTNHRLDAIERKPGQRWDNLVGTILTVLASGIAGYLLSHFLGG